jgi:hypothetical protein
VKYLKSFYSLNELNINSDEFNQVIIDINDILLELEDEARISTSINITGKNRKYIGFYLKDHMNYDGFMFSEVSDYVFRLKDYLGDNLRSCSVLFVKDKNRYGVGGGRITINLNSERDIRKLKESPIENLIIDIK